MNSEQPRLASWAKKGNLDALKKFWESYLQKIRDEVRTNPEFFALLKDHDELHIQWHHTSPDDSDEERLGDDRPGEEELNDDMGWLRTKNSVLAVIRVSTSEALAWDKLHPDLLRLAMALMQNQSRPSVLLIESTSTFPAGRQCQVSRFQRPGTFGDQPTLDFDMSRSIGRDMEENYTVISWVIIMGLLAEKRAQTEKITVLDPEAR